MKQFLDILARLHVAAAGCMLFVFTTVVSYQVFSRYTTVVPRYFWTEEVSRFSFIWMTLLGSAAAVWYGAHFDIDLIPAQVDAKVGGILRAGVQIVVAIVGLVMILGGIHFVEMGMSRISTTSGIRMAWIHVAVPVAGLSILVFALGRLVYGTGADRESAYE